MTHDVFVCHSSEDKAVADAVCAVLEQQRIRCWIAPRDVIPGSDYAQSIVEAIGSSRLLVLVFSSHANSSAHVHREVERAVSHGIPILPFRVESVAPSPSLEYFISNAHWLDAVTPPLEEHLHHLTGTVGLLLERERTGSVGGALPPPLAPAPAARYAAPTGVPLGPPPRRGRGWMVAAGLGVAALVAVVVGVVATTGGGDEGGEVAPAATDEPVADTAGDASTGSGATSVPGATGGEMVGPVDVLSSFGFDESVVFEMGGDALSGEVHGTFVAPDQQECRMTVRFSGLEQTISMIVIGSQAWYDEGAGMQATTPDDPDVASFATSCPTSHEFWGEDLGIAPAGGTSGDLAGMPVLVYDLTSAFGTWGPMLGLPSGVTAEQLVIYTSPDAGWVAGFDAILSGDAAVFRSSMGFPPEGMDGAVRLTMSLHLRQPNDPGLFVLPPM